MSLQKEINKTRSEIRTDSYPMSIGELASLYANNEIDIHPEFQRFYRWTSYQKSRLIESIILGIPIPQIFVAQRKDGVWDVVDGLQRLATIFHFMGILKNENNELITPLVLEKTKYLPSLEAKKWDDKDNEENSLDSAQRLIIKRSKIDISIILMESDEKSKYELFQRLNTGGSPLSDQEVRNSILVMINRDYYRWLKNLSRNGDFQDCILITDKALEEQYDMDLLLRFVLLRKMEESRLKKIGDINSFLTEEMIDVVTNEKLNIDEETRAFESTFSILVEQLSSDCFKKYNPVKKKFGGGFLISAFELVALGVGYNYSEILSNPIDIISITKKLWSDDEFKSNSGSGVRASTRIPNILSLGRRSFKP